MPQRSRKNPPPHKPVDDEDAEALRDLAMVCNYWRLLATTNQMDRVELSQAAMHKVIQIEGQLKSKDQNKAWALYDSYIASDEEQKSLWDLTYLKGDVINILDAEGRWVLGVCRGRIGIACVDHLEYDEFFRALWDFDATKNDEMSFRKGQIFPAMRDTGDGWFMAYKDNEGGYIPGNHVEPLKTPFAQRFSPGCYQYKPLNEGEIRLIHFSENDNKLYQACGGDTVFLSLVHVRLDAAPPFTAISYCCGDTNHLESVFCNDRPLRVTANLALSLQWFASIESKPKTSGSDGEQYIWADAICISQNDMVERARQVSRMREIYGNAKHVKVYLGESDDVWKVMMSFAVIDKVIGDGPMFSTNPSPEVRENLVSLDMASIAKFLANPAFQRSWMIQEMVLGNDVALWYGKIQLRLEQISSYIRFQDSANLRLTNANELTLTPEQESNVALGTYNADNIGKIRLMWHQGEPKSFIEVLRRFRGAKATDLRDKMYSLISLADDHYFKSIVPSYAESSKAANIFIHVANLAVTSPRKEDLAILLDNAGFHVLESLVGHELPTWVPDWTLLPRVPVDPAFYSCSDSTTLSARLTSPGPACREVAIKGAIIDHVSLLGPVWLYKETEQPLPMFEAVKDMRGATLTVHDELHVIAETMIATSTSYPLPGCTFDEAIWQTLVCGRGWGQRRAAPEDMRHYHAYLKQNKITPLQQTQSVEDQSESTDDDYPFRILLQHFQPGRRVGVTRKFYFGTFPSETDVASGDIVAMLFGMTVPFVLRPHRPGGQDAARQTYQLIGPCYVHGIMDGELIHVQKIRGFEVPFVRGGKVEEFVLV